MPSPAAQRELAGIAKQQRWYSFSGSPILNVAGGLVRIPAQAKLPDSLRLPQYRGGRHRPDQGLRCGGRSKPSPTPKKQMLQAWLTQASKDLPVNDPYLDGISGRPESRGGCGGGGQRNQAGRFHGTGSLLAGGSAAVASSKDPLIALARKLNPIAMRVQQRAAHLSDVTTPMRRRSGGPSLRPTAGHFRPMPRSVCESAMAW